MKKQETMINTEVVNGVLNMLNDLNDNVKNNPKVKEVPQTEVPDLFVKPNAPTWKFAI